MYILLHAGGMPFNGDTIPSGKGLGGSESAAYYMAKELVELGHHVDVFTQERQGGLFDGVHYHWIGQQSEQFPLGEQFTFVAKIPHDVCIIQRSPFAFTAPVNSKLNIWWVHDLGLLRSKQMIYTQRWNIDAVFPVSQWHSDQIKEVYGFSDDVLYPTANGFDYSQVKDVQIDREEKSLVYAARPERGLLNLVGEGGIMEMLPDYKLYLCGYDNTTPHMQELYSYLWGRCEVLPNVENVGSLSKQQLLSLMEKCKAYVYPTEFEETFCTMVLEANAVGTPFISTSAGALPYTVGGTGGKIIDLYDNKISEPAGKKKFIKELREVLEDEHKWESMHRHALKRRVSWKSIAQDWDNTFTTLFRNKTSDPVRLAKHFEHMSDIVAADKLGLTEHIPDFWDNYHFYKNDNYAEHYKKYYQYEKDRGVVYGPEDLAGNSRFIQVLELIDNSMKETIKEDGQEFSILDYGCAHGHYVMNILKRISYKGLNITGVDIEESNITTAVKWALDDKESRAVYYCGTHNVIPDKKFDVILLGEILEHVPDPVLLLKKLKKFCKSSTRFIITTPYGPWEAQGYNEHKGWRAHIHHFERPDCEDIFGEQEKYKLFGVPSGGLSMLGSWVVTYQSSNIPYGQIDYDRKGLIQNPRETVALCMIAKDEENTLGKTLEVIAPYVDEIIIGVDKTSSEKFYQFLANNIDEEYKVKKINITSPKEIGFDEARNHTIKEAKSDWILWLDADEVIDYPENIAKYLRSNCLNGYGINQVHVATQPQGHLKTDYPSRLFRNNGGIKFYGFVHEHPEAKFNEGVGEVFIAPDVSILHTGYISEKVRRKRFERNWPLMLKDREKYPDRNLGTFLYMRDLTHMNRYEKEVNGNRGTPAIEQRAKEAIAIWKSLVDSGNTRFVVEGLGYYSESVLHLIGNSGLEFTLDMKISHPATGGNSNFSDTIKGYFMDSKDIKLLVDRMYKEVTNVYKEKYL